MLTHRAATDIREYINHEYSYDALGNIVAIAEHGLIKDSTFSYDDLSRLVTFERNGYRGYNQASYLYDYDGNRLEEIVFGNNSRPITYSYEDGTNRLEQLSWERDRSTCGGDPEEIQERTINHNNAGKQQNGFKGKFPLADSEYSISYGRHGRISLIQSGDIQVTYTYNYKQLRTKKTITRISTQEEIETRHFFYDQTGKIMSERIVTPSQEDKWFDYIYLGGILIGRIDSQVNGEANVYAYHNDHLGTPLIMTDNNQEVVWAADYEPFGAAWVTTSTIENNIRFPGQYYDDESGMHYNWHRYYQPEFGAYAQADPLSLRQVVSFSFSYAKSNPSRIIDFTGLKPGDKYATALDAARDALIDALKETFIPSNDEIMRYSEHGGYIYKFSGCNKFSYTTPKSSNRPSAIIETDYEKAPLNTTLVGNYHTHTFVDLNNPNEEYNPFSSQDIIGYKYDPRKLVGYLAVLDVNRPWLNRMWVFDPRNPTLIKIHNLR